MIHDEMIAVIQAHKDGKIIEYREHGNHAWIQTLVPAWNFGQHVYRIKPEPMEIWVNVYADGNLGCAYESWEWATSGTPYLGRRTIKFREVLDE